MLLGILRTAVSNSIVVVSILLLSSSQKNGLVNAYFMEGVQYEVRAVTSDSFETEVIESKEAWILALTESKISEEQWQKEENQLRGVVNVAFIDMSTDGEFLFAKGILKRGKSNSVAVVFPYGGIRTKKTKHKEVNSVKEAKRIALSSLSENYVTWIKDKLHVETFVREAYTSWPPRFPVVLTTERKVIPPLFRAISIKYSKYFNFAVVHSSNAKAVLGLVDGAKIPRMDVLVSAVSKNESVTMHGLTYTEAYGPVRYPYLIRFLYSAHAKYWPEHPGAKTYTEDMDMEEHYKQDLKIIFANPVSHQKYKTTDEKRKLPKMEEITYDNHKTICHDSTQGFCVIAFFDGSPKVFAENYVVFSQVHKIKHFQGKPLQFMWINASCYPEYGTNFGISLESLPALLVTRPQRRHFVMHSGQFTRISIGEFIERIFTGRLGFKPYSRFDNLENRSCEKPKLNDTKRDPHVEQEEIKETKEEKMENKEDETGGLKDREEL